MSDINTPGRAHPQDPAEGPDDASARNSRPVQTGQGEGAAGEETIDEAAPDEDMAGLNTIEPPPPVDASIQGVPDASEALEDTGPDDPGANATGVGI
jgi:hypothetical protein